MVTREMCLEGAKQCQQDCDTCTKAVDFHNKPWKDICWIRRLRYLLGEVKGTPEMINQAKKMKINVPIF